MRQSNSKKRKSERRNAGRELSENSGSFHLTTRKNSNRDYLSPDNVEHADTIENNLLFIENKHGRTLDYKAG